MLVVLAIVGLTYSIMLLLEKSSSLEYKTEYFDVLGYRWAVEIHKNGYFEIDDTPLSIKHDLPLVETSTGQRCPEIINDKCECELPDKEFNAVFAVAKSYIDKMVRDKQSS